MEFGDEATGFCLLLHEINRIITPPNPSKLIAAISLFASELPQFLAHEAQLRPSSIFHECACKGDDKQMNFANERVS